MKIKHNEEMLSNAISFDEEEIKELESYVSKLFKYMNSGKIKASHVYEKLLTQLSYKDLVWLSTQYIIETHEKLVEKKLELINDLNLEIFDDE